MKKRIDYWDKDVDPKNMLWVCQSCDSHLNSDCVGDKCPACSADATEQDADKRMKVEFTASSYG
jgi:rubrerythrin